MNGIEYCKDAKNLLILTCIVELRQCDLSLTSIIFFLIYQLKQTLAEICMIIMLKIINFVNTYADTKAIV